MGFPGGWEWFVILLIALLIFGSRLPSVMRSLGSSVNEFKRGLSEEPTDDKDTESGKELAEGSEEEEAVAAGEQDEGPTAEEQTEKADHVTA